MATVRIVDADKQDRNQRLVVIVLFVVGILGISYLVYDYLSIINRVALPEDTALIDPIVQQWKKEGLVSSFDSKNALLVVEESKWKVRDRDSKIGIIVRLGRYCAQKNNSPTWAFKIVGSTSRKTLGEMGQSGLVVQ
jgi:hypothetical protein